MKKLLLILAVLALMLIACGRPSAASSNLPAASDNTSGACPMGNTVYTGSNFFEQSCITLSKGSTLTITPDQVSYHVLAYGQWNGSTAQPQATPPGAPDISGAVMNSQSIEVGPFATAGTYHIYCTVHPGMDLTVVVS